MDSARPCQNCGDPTHLVAMYSESKDWWAHDDTGRAECADIEGKDTADVLRDFARKHAEYTGSPYAEDTIFWHAADLICALGKRKATAEIDVTEDEVEAGARALHEREHRVTSWDNLTVSGQGAYRNEAQVVLEAALRKRRDRDKA